MRPLLFLVADKTMEHMLLGFFERERWDRVVSCQRFDFDPNRDIIVAAGQSDPGLFTRANELLRPFYRRYKRVVVMVDADWDGSPGPDVIRQRIREHIVNAGWSENEGLALVLEPEVDAWLWSDSPRVPEEFGWKEGWNALRPALEGAGLLAEGAVKPEKPKEAAEWALRHSRQPRSAALYKRIARKVSLKRCKDQSVHDLLETLRRWFPAE